MDTEIKDVIDAKRKDDGEQGLSETIDQTEIPSTDFEGHGVLLVARETVRDEMPLCLGLGDSGNRVSNNSQLHRAVLCD